MNSRTIQFAIATTLGLALGVVATVFWSRHRSLTVSRETPAASNPAVPVAEVTVPLAVKLQRVWVSETRNGSYPIFVTPNSVAVGLRVELDFVGMLVQSSLKYSDASLTFAVDDMGNDLILRHPIQRDKPAQPPEFHFIEHRQPEPAWLRPQAISVKPGGSATVGSDSHRELNADNESKNLVKVQVFLRLPKRNASMLKALEGTVQFMQSSGTMDAIFPAVKAQLGKTLEDVNLVLLGVTISAQAAPKTGFVGDPDRALTLRVEGKRDAVLAVAFLNKEGRRLPYRMRGQVVTPFGLEWTYLFDKALTDDVSLCVTIAKEVKIIDVPFRIRNFPLP
jgi:hypothetical protein